MPAFKENVNCDDMSKDITRHHDAIDKVHRDILGRIAMITSCRDGKHMTGSLHYKGRAIDLRTRDMTREKAKQLVKALKSARGKSFDVVLESDHIHLEFDPK